MTGIRTELSKRSWLRIYRLTGLLATISVMSSVILSNVFMEIFSEGNNVEGLVVSIAMPLLLGSPVIFFMTLRQEQLRHLNRQLEHLARTDWLTTCLNRGAFTGAVTRHLEHSPKNDSRTGALLVIDADNFKAVNDQFGHQCGDEALRLIADAMRASVRSTDLVGRLGGEEFGIFIADMDMAAVDLVAERIRQAVAAIEFTPNGQAHHLAVSVGGAAFVGPAEFSELYRLADLRLYEAKHQGRDRVAMVRAA